MVNTGNCVEHNRCWISNTLHVTYEMAVTYTRSDALVKYLRLNFPGVRQVFVYQTLGEERGPHLRAHFKWRGQTVRLRYDTSHKKLNRVRTEQATDYKGRTYTQYHWLAAQPRGWTRVTKLRTS